MEEQMKVKDIIFEYLKDYKYQIKEHTFWIYFFMARRLDNDLIIHQNVDKNYLNEYLLKKNWAYSTKKMFKSLINRSLDYANESGLFCFKNRITLRLQQNYKRKVDALTKKEQQKLEEHILQKKSYYHYGILICLYTGMRIGELLSLRWQDIDLKNNYINIKATTCYIAGKDITDFPKTISSYRQIPIVSNLKQILLNMYQGGEYVVCGRNKQCVRTKTYEKSFDNLLKKLKIKHYNFHALRHTFASRLLENCIDVKTISELMGHAKTNITLNTYVHTTETQKNKAINSLFI